MSSFGRLFRVTTFGESHGKGVGCIIDSFPSGVKLSEKDIQIQLDRRKPNQNSLLSARNEPDIVTIYSGVENGITLGTPICLVVNNIDAKPGEYKSFSEIPRPGHADYTYLSKYGIKSISGGGRASARETVARVAAGASAEKYLKEKFGVEIVAYVNSVGNIQLSKDVTNKINSGEIYDKVKFTRELVDELGTFKIFTEEGDGTVIIYNKYTDKAFYLEKIGNIKNIDIKFDKDEDIISVNYNENKYIYKEDVNIRCPDVETGAKMIREIINVKSNNDSIGGTVSCVIYNCPKSLGEPCFDKFEAELAKAMLSIPATKGFEIGSGFEGTKMLGSEHNDLFKSTLDTEIKNDLSLHKLNINPSTNNAGGILGGITTGAPIYFRVAIKPVSTISKEQSTVDYSGNDQVLKVKGRHDPCVLPRAMPIVESMAALVIMDFCLIQLSRLNSKIDYDIQEDLNFDL